MMYAYMARLYSNYLWHQKMPAILQSSAILGNPMLITLPKVTIVVVRIMLNPIWIFSVCANIDAFIETQRHLQITKFAQSSFTIFSSGTRTILTPTKNSVFLVRVTNITELSISNTIT